MIHLRPYQRAAVDLVDERACAGVRRLLLVLPTGGGKCLGLGTPVLRYDGTIVAVEDVRPGDLLMGPDSKPRRVLSTTRGVGQLFRVTPTKGESWVCNDVHVLTLVHTVSGEVVDVDLPAYLAETRHFRHCHKQFTPPDGIDFAPAEPLPLDPYFLGVWYGDGTHALHGVAVSKPDPEIEALMADFAARFGLHLRTDGTSCPTHHLSGERGRSNPLLTLLRRIVGDQSALPYAYLTASREDRAAFLAGLLDTDGYLHRSGYEIVQLRRAWADGVAFLARSLGLRALLSPKVVNETTYWRVSISGDCSGLPLRIQRKQAPPRRQKKCATRTGITVEPVGVGEYAGFELDGDGRFLLGDFTVTHNTVVAAYILARAAARGQRSLFLAHRREIVAQAWAKLVEAGVEERQCGVIMADGRITHPRTRETVDARRPGALVQVASVQTLSQRPKPPAEVVFVDEAHHAAAGTWSKVIAHYQERGALIIGLTATPERADGKGLAEHFDELHVLARPAELVAGGYLVAPEVYTAEEFADLSGVKVERGDYAQGALERAMDRPRLIGNLVAHYQRLGAGRRAIVFAAGVEHSRHLAAAFWAAGFAAEHLDGTTPRDERDAILGRLRAGATRVVCNVGVLTEGFDEPSVKVVAVARPTKSLALWLQMAGRGLRPWEGAGALLLDHAGGYLPHGLPQEDRLWSLEGRPKGSGGGGAHRACPSCRRVVPLGACECPGCGHAFERQARPLQLVDGELQRIDTAKAEELARERMRKKVNTRVGRVVDAWVAIGHLRDSAWSAVNRAIYATFRKSRTKMSSGELLKVAEYLDSGAYDREHVIAPPPARAAMPIDVEVVEPMPELPETVPWVDLPQEDRAELCADASPERLAEELDRTPAAEAPKLTWHLTEQQMQAVAEVRRAEAPGRVSWEL